MMFVTKNQFYLTWKISIRIDKEKYYASQKQSLMQKV